MAEDIDILQELLDSEAVMSALGFPVNAQQAVDAIKDLRRLSGSQDSAGVRKAWETLSGALGPRLMASFLSGPDWAKLCPLRHPLDDYASGDLTQEVWLGNSRKVVATAAMDGEEFVGVTFTDEPR